MLMQQKHLNKIQESKSSSSSSRYSRVDVDAKDNLGTTTSSFTQQSIKKNQ